MEAEIKKKSARKDNCKEGFKSSPPTPKAPGRVI